MNAIDLIHDRFAATAATHRDLVEAASGLDWTTPLLPDTSPIGLTLWHVPRTVDWLINTSIRDVAEVADGAAYGDLPPVGQFGFGTGLTPAQASDAAAQVDPAALLTYAGDVFAAADEWLASLSDADLDDSVPEFDSRQRTRPAYCTPAALEEVGHLGTLTVGQLLLRPAMSHLFRHVGELELLVAHARRAAG